MKTMSLISPAMVCGIAGVLCVTYALCAEPPAGKITNATGSSPYATDSTVDEKDRVSVAVASDRAKIMHDIYVATLHMMHHYYFHGDRAVVPARAMEDVFSEIKRQSNAEARWISVNMKAMSVSHEPETGFEKRAVEQIAAGKTEFVMVDGGYYRHAGVIPLTDGCISCHGGFFKEPSKTPKFAGLVISIPIDAGSVKPD